MIGAQDRTQDRIGRARARTMTRRTGSDNRPPPVDAPWLRAIDTPVHVQVRAGRLWLFTPTKRLILPLANVVIRKIGQGRGSIQDDQPNPWSALNGSDRSAPGEPGAHWPREGPNGVSADRQCDLARGRRNGRSARQRKAGGLDDDHHRGKQCPGSIQLPAGQTRTGHIFPGHPGRRI